MPHVDVGVPKLTVIEWTYLGTMLDIGIGTNGPSLRSLLKTLEGLTINPILFLSLVIILSAALPWWPYSAYGKITASSPVGLATGYAVARRLPDLARQACSRQERL